MTKTLTITYEILDRWGETYRTPFNIDYNDGLELDKKILKITDKLARNNVTVTEVDRY